MAFEGLTEKLNAAFKKLRGKGRLTENDVREAMREVRLALLEADVGYKVVKEFVATVTERAIGSDVLESLTPAQQVIKIVNEELTNLMGGGTAKIAMANNGPTVVMMVGLQGAGKTTTINMLNGVFPATSGKITFEGQEITGMATYKIARLGVARTFQNIKLFNSLTVEENLMIGGQAKYAKGSIVEFLLNPKKAAQEEKVLKEVAAEVMEKLKITDIAHRTVDGLPYGKLKMVELARSMMSSPKLILLDEPAAGLNPSERVEFLESLIQLFESGVDLFLVEHNMDVVMKISHNITVINFGSKIAEGKPKEIQNNPEVIKAYLGDRYKAE